MRKVSFPTRNPFLFTDMHRHEVRRTFIPGKGYLFEPRKAHGPIPATVILEGLGGLKRAREFDYGRQLAARGQMALVVDTFGTRGYARNSHTWRALRVTEAMFVADAFAACRYLARRPDVDADAISVMGFSYGGMVSVLTAYEQLCDLFTENGEAFAGHVSLYGSSVPRLDHVKTTGAPVLMMLGELDRNVSVPRTHAIAGDLRAGGSEVEVMVIKGAYHQWDADDLTKRFVQFAIPSLELKLDQKYEIRDGRSGAPVRGFLGRALTIARGTSLRGYHILRDETAKHFSDQALHRFLTRVAEGARRLPLGQRMPEAAGQPAE